MKRLAIYLISFLSLAGFASCSDDNDLPEVVATDSGTVTDDEGNTYEWVRIGDLDWTTTNADNGPLMDDFRYYDNIEWVNAFSKKRKKWLQSDYHPVYGNLMTWEDAMASAPDGWRVPTDEDWQNLERTLGMTNTADRGWRGEQGVGKLMQQTDTGCRLGLLLGGFMTIKPKYGWVDFDVDFIDEYGAYWTSTIAEKGENYNSAWYRKVHCINGGVDREVGRCDKLMAVRWCRDAR